MISSLASPLLVPPLASNLPHLHSFVVLSKKSSNPTLSSRRNSLTSSCSTSSNCSDDEVNSVFDHETEDCCIVYESYAAVTKRTNGTRASISWNDLQHAESSKERVHLRAALRHKYQHHTRHSETFLELVALELCFEFLTLEELVNAAYVCTVFHDVMTSSKTLLIGLYSRQWRVQMLPEPYVKLAYPAQLTLCTERQANAAYKLSTRSTVTSLANGNYHVVNNSMLRNFEKGAVDSIRGIQKLPVLSCARALQKRVSYYEVSLEGCGSIGLVSISDTTTRNAYGFGSGEHVGWKGVSYGYHGNDGDFVYNDGTKSYGGEWSAFGPSWGRVTTRSGPKDESTTFTVGCGFDADKYQIFFTLNGKMIGAAFKTVIPGDYAAAISLHAFGDEVVINTGASPFLFDIEAFCASP